VGVSLVNMYLISKVNGLKNINNKLHGNTIPIETQTDNPSFSRSEPNTDTPNLAVSQVTNFVRSILKGVGPTLQNFIIRNSSVPWPQQYFTLNLLECNHLNLTESLMKHVVFFLPPSKTLEVWLSLDSIFKRFEFYSRNKSKIKVLVSLINTLKLSNTVNCNYKHERFEPFVGQRP
jgi:hypothetical protein